MKMDSTDRVGLLILAGLAYIGAITAFSSALMMYQSEAAGLLLAGVMLLIPAGFVTYKCLK